MLKRSLAACMLAAVSLLQVHALTLDQRQNVNLLNSPYVTLAAMSGTQDFSAQANQMRGVYWNVWNFDCPNDQDALTVTVDLGKARNVKTLKWHNNDSWGFFSTAVVEYSTDGGTSWNPLTGTQTTTNGGMHVAFVADTAVNAQHVRFSLNGLTDPTGYKRLLTARWGIYGDVGSILDDGQLSLTADASSMADFVTFNQVGGNVEGSFVTANPEPFNNRIWYNISQGDYAEYKFAKQIPFGKFGISTDPYAGQFDANMTWRLLGSTDGGATYPTVLLDNVGLAAGVQYFDIPFFKGNAMKWVAVSATGSSRFGGLFFYSKRVPGDANSDAKVDFADYLILESTYGSAPTGDESADFDGNNIVEFADYLVLEANYGADGTVVPEPASLSLLALGALALLRRKH